MMRKAAMTAGLCALIAGGCAKEPQWHKSGATTESAAADLQACRASVPLEPRKPLGPPTKPGMGGSFDAAFDREADRMRRDEQQVAECMRAKGYTDAAR